jgi:Mn-containing catalase
MKNLKNVLLTTALILMGLFSFAQEQETITLVSSKNLNGATEVFVDLHGNVQAEIWNKDYIRIVLEIKTNGVTREVVKHLMTKKRFKISSYKKDQNSLKLSNPNIVLPVYINGRRLKEDVNYKIFVPRNTLVTINTAEETPVESVSVSL